jgi:hypothetical protein
MTGAHPGTDPDWRRMAVTWMTAHQITASVSGLPMTSVFSRA